MRSNVLTWRRTNGFIWLLCLALAALWDFLFWGEPVGISVAIFTGVMAVTLVLRTPVLWKTMQGRFIACMTGLAVVALIEEPSSLAILMMLLAMGTLVLISQRDLSLLRDSVLAWIWRWMALAVTLWVRIFLDNAIVARWVYRHPQIGRKLTRVMTALAWWVLPLMAGAIFAGLFALANPVIAQFFGHIQDFLADAFTWLMRLEFTRMLVWAVVIVLAYGLLRHRHRWGTKMQVPPVVAVSTNDWLTGPPMIIRLLLVLNVVFVVENALDAAYLYMGVPLPKGLYYREYAHRGAYTLIVTAMLAGVFTLASFRQRGTAHRSRACRWLVYVWIGQNIFLLVSTVVRVWHYVDMDKLTRLRLSTMIWCGLVASGFLWIILRIRNSKTNTWLLRVNAFTALGVLFVCAFINFDGMIASFNVRHCAQAGGRGSELDTEYLKHLGPASLPALAWLNEHPGKMTDSERSLISEISGELRRELNGELSDWRGWTYRRWREADGKFDIAAAAKEPKARPQISQRNADVAGD